jgi:hypothetical protein
MAANVFAPASVAMLGRRDRSADKDPAIAFVSELR